MRQPAIVQRPGRAIGKTPLVNILKSQGAYRIDLALPGFTREQIQLEVADQQLTVRTVAAEAPNPGSKFTRKEFHYSGFSRTFRLPEHTDTARIEAHLEAGVLRITLPAVEPTSKSIHIQ